MENSSERWIRLAQILRPQGRKGEVLADLYTDFPDQFASQSRLALAPDGFADRVERGETVNAPEPVQIIAHWLPVGRNAGRVVLQLAGVSSIEQAEALSGKEVVMPASERRMLDDGSVYVSDLVGATVQDRGRPIGVIVEVLFPANPDGTRKLEEAAPLLTVSSPDGEEILIPFASAFVENIDVPGKLLHMQLPKGLIDINRTGPPDRSSPEENTEMGSS